jgi:hypothetical protein
VRNDTTPLDMVHLLVATPEISSLSQTLYSEDGGEERTKQENVKALRNALVADGLSATEITKGDEILVWALLLQHPKWHANSFKAVQTLSETADFVTLFDEVKAAVDEAVTFILDLASEQRFAFCTNSVLELKQCLQQRGCRGASFDRVCKAASDTGSSSPSQVKFEACNIAALEQVCHVTVNFFGSSRKYQWQQASAAVDSGGVMHRAIRCVKQFQANNMIVNSLSSLIVDSRVLIAGNINQSGCDKHSVFSMCLLEERRG